MMRLLLVGLWAALASAQDYNRVYTASLSQFLGSGVGGRVTVFAASSDSVAYVGFGSGLVNATDCTGANACGVAIHEGTSCESVETQGGPLFADPVTENPWSGEKYVTDASGGGSFKGIVTTGTSAVQGRLFILYGQDGSRIACGTFNEVPLSNDLTPIFFTRIAPYPGNTASGFVTTISGSNRFGEVCMYATASGLQGGLSSILDGGQDCQATYGCGMIIHDQEFECTTPEDVGSPFFSVAINPWTEVGYLSTDGDGNTEFFECTQIGTRFVEDQTFVVYNNEGAPNACGVLGRVVGPSAPPTSAPTRAPTTESPTTFTPKPTETMRPTTATRSPTDFPESTRAPSPDGGGEPPSGSVTWLHHGTGRFLIAASACFMAWLLV